jgi:uncharacterized membrane protein YkoI
LACKSNHHEEREEHREGPHATMSDIDKSALPDAVKSGFAKAYPGATITKAEKETYKDGKVHYEVEYKTADGKEGDVELDANGNVLPEH